MRVESLTHHAMGRLADGTLVPRVLPGEEVEPRGDGTWRVLSPSPDRVAAPCPHFAACGGCAVQHASDPFVAAWKADVVRAALRGQGIEGEVAGVLTSPPRTRRRARLSGRRTRRGAIVGFHARASEAIVEVPRCQVLDPRIVALLPALAEATHLAASRSAEVALAVTVGDGAADLALSGGRDLTPGLRAEAAAWAERAGLGCFTWNNEAIARASPPRQRMGRAVVEPPPGAFLQATPEGEAALVALVREALGEASRVADLFAGVGTFALPLAEGAEVHAVESDAAMLAALDRAWRGAPGLKRVTTEARDLFRRPLLVPELARLDAVVLDPPRAGAEAQVAEVARAGVPVVAYAACDPRSFARDARAFLAGGYRMGPVAVVDQFRWSAHVELFARFHRP